MPITASTIISRASTTLLDPSGVAWTTSELLDYLNAAQRAACMLRPDCYTKVATLSLVSGVVQSIPSDGHAILRVLYNESGVSVAHAGIDSLLRSTNWAQQTPSLNISEWAADSRSPTIFYVSPPSNGASKVVCVYAAVPPVLTSTSSPIGLPDIYETPLWAYVCAMAYAKNSRRQDMVKHQSMMQLFTATLGGGAITQQAIFPDLKKIEQGQS